MTQATAIPVDVTNAPAGPDGNGFLWMDVSVSSMVGSDGNIYIRKNGVVSLAPEDEESDTE